MKKTFKRFSVRPTTVQNNKYLKLLKLDNPKLWNFNHRTISKGVAVGLFCACIPIPIQMIFAAIFAVYFSANILVSIGLVWISNPLTIPPIFYLFYKIGATILGVEITHFEFSMEYLWDTMLIVWKPLLLGSTIMAVLTSLIGYFLVYLFYWIKHYKRLK